MNEKDSIIITNVNDVPMYMMFVMKIIKGSNYNTKKINT